MQVGEGPRIHAIADEDMERENETKTSAVHFLRFELDAESKRAAAEGGGAVLRFGVEHAAYRESLTAPGVAAGGARAEDLA